MKRKQLTYQSSWISRKNILLYVFFFSVLMLCIAMYLYTKQSRWLENEFGWQVQKNQIKNEVARQSIYIQNAESLNSKYAISGNSKISKTFTTTIDSLLATNARLRHLQKREENKTDLLLFLQSDELIKKEIDFMQLVRKLCDNGNREAALTLVATNKELLLPDSILAINNKISNQLNAKLIKSQIDFLEVNSRNNVIALSGIIASTLLLLGVLFFILLLNREMQHLNTELENRVAQRTAQLETANTELEAFSYSVSHDLRAPLRAISAYSLILKEDYSQLFDNTANKFLNIVIESGKHMGQLIDDLLKFSQLGRLDAIKANVDMTRIVQNVIDEMAIMKDLTGYAIRLNPLPACSGDINMLKQVWFNLFDNAVKYASKQEKPVIEISYKEDKLETIYFIKDNGVGFDIMYADKLFGVFQRLHRKDEFEGTGLGLSLVKRIIEKHKGRVFAESVLYHGSTFYFTLPKYDI